MGGKQFKELAAMMMIGEGIIGTIAPARHTRLWETGPSLLRKVSHYLSKRRTLVRTLAIAETGLGGWLAWRLLRR